MNPTRRSFLGTAAAAAVGARLSRLSAERAYAADPAAPDASDPPTLLARTHDVAMSGKFEPFKTTVGFDGTARHPEWLGQEG